MSDTNTKPTVHTNEQAMEELVSPHTPPPEDDLPDNLFPGLHSQSTVPETPPPPPRSEPLCPGAPKKRKVRSWEETKKSVHMELSVRVYDDYDTVSTRSRILYLKDFDSYQVFKMAVKDAYAELAADELVDPWFPYSDIQFD